MTNLILTDVGPDKVKTIKVVREIKGLELKEAKDIVDLVAGGTAYTFTNLVDSEAELAIKKFNEIGAVVNVELIKDERNSYLDENSHEEKQAFNFNASSPEASKFSEEDTNSIHNNNTYKTGRYTPPVDFNKVPQLDREGTMKVLKECEKIASGYEKVESEITSIRKNIAGERKKSDELRNAISPKAQRISLIVIILAFLMGLIVGPLCIVTGIAAYFIMSMTVIKKDRIKHSEENNANADAYLREHVEPLECKLNDLCAERDDYLNNGKCDWARSIVGKDLFYSACINDLYKLVESYRADSLKEALILYDDVQYKARMEEMQSAIQNATELAAVESKKQTEYSQQIAASSRQAANAAKANAAHTRAIEKNTRKFR